MDTATQTPPRRRGPKLPELALSDEERITLQRWARRATSGQALALRCRIVLACADGASNAEVAARLGISRPTVTKWRSRFVARRLEGLADEPRPGAARTITDEQVEQVLVATLETTPADATHWSTRSLARQLGMSQSAISRIWRAFGLKPHLVDTFKLSTDPQFIEKVRDVVGLYLNPPRRPWCCAWTRRRACRRSTAPPRSCRCCQGPRSGPPTTTPAMAPPTCTPPWKWPAARSSRS
jgi:transposase